MFRSIVLTHWTAMRAKASDGQRTFTELAPRPDRPVCGGGHRRDRQTGRVAKSVVSYHFSDKAELMGEVLRTALATYAKFMEPRMAVATSASDSSGPT